jgi:hypothetical protein
MTGSTNNRDHRSRTGRGGAGQTMMIIIGGAEQHHHGDGELRRHADHGGHHHGNEAMGRTALSDEKGRLADTSSPATEWAESMAPSWTPSSGSGPKKRPSDMSPARRGRRETPRNWLRNTAFRADVVVHSGGHKLQPVLCGNPYFTVFSEFPRPLDWNPSLSDTDF